MIKSLTEYIEKVHEIFPKLRGIKYNTTTLPWFRGQTDTNWDLLPCIYRNGDNRYEKDIISNFYLNGQKFIEKPLKYEFELLFLLQHYGMPTRLLDWSESHLIALYFALLKYKDKDVNATVWVMHPWSLNEVTLKHSINGKLSSNSKQVPNCIMPELNGYLLNVIEGNFDNKIEEEYPIAIRPFKTTPRIIAQKGVFTIHGNNKKSLNEIFDELKAEGSEKFRLEKIEIHGPSKIKILRELYLAGISHSVLFPELEGLAKEMSFRYSKNFMGGTKGHNHNGF